MSRPFYQRWLFPATIAAVLLLVAAGLLSSPPATQMRIIRDIRRAGGKVKLILPDRAGWLGYFKSTLPDAFGQVYSVELADVPVSKHWLQAFREWKYLRLVWLNRASLQDSDLRSLEHSAFLRELYLSGNPITSEGLKSLGLKPNLTRLELNWTRITDLEPLPRQFLRLHTLKLRGTRLKDGDLDPLRGLPALHHIDLTRTPITDSGLKVLSHCPTLQVVQLQGTPTTHAGARELMKSRRLGVIYSSDGKPFHTLAPDD